MIVNYFTFVDELEVTRNACVVDGQPFYCSSGTSSGLNGVWLPFKKFDQQIPRVTGQIHKLDIAYSYDRTKNIRNYFPSGVANALQKWEDQDSNNNWGRFGNMKCLLISCMLSNEATVPVDIRKAVIDYVGENNYKNSYLWARPTIFDCGYMLKTRTVNRDTLEECNNKLLQLGAIIPKELPFFEQLSNNLNFNPPQPEAQLYPDVLEPAGLLQQFINSIPSLITREMRFFTCYMRGEQAAPGPDADNPPQNDRQQGQRRT